MATKEPQSQLLHLCCHQYLKHTRWKLPQVCLSQSLLVRAGQGRWGRLGQSLLAQALRELRPSPIFLRWAGALGAATAKALGQVSAGALASALL